MSFLLNDLHCHTHLSSCCHDENMTAETILRFAEEHNYSSLCLTDHLWDRAVPGASDWYAPQDVEHVRKALPLPSSDKLPFYFGCETELPINCVPALHRDNFDLFDFVVIPVNHMHMKGLNRPYDVDTPEKMAEYILTRLERLLERDLPFNKIGLAHFTCPLMFAEGSVADVISHMSEQRLLRIMKGYAEAGTGVELNCASFEELETRPEETLRMYRASKEAGCKFYFSSDAHAVGQLNCAPALGPKLVDLLGLDASHQYIIPA